MCCSSSGQGDRSVYIHGGSKQTNTQNIGAAPFGVTSCRFADFTQNSTHEIAECAIWNSVLTDAEVLSLARGANPMSVSAHTLAGYWPMWGNQLSGTEWSWVNAGSGRDLTVDTNALKGPNHPPIAYPQEQLTILPAEAAQVGPIFRPPLRPYEHNLTR
jgi:hypothetical protein